MIESLGYVWAQLAHAMRDERSDKIAKWSEVLRGMQRGTLRIGSRTPTEAPAWVTLEVVTGGFATGTYLAGGPLLDRERALAETLDLPATRLALNVHFLTSDDAAAWLASGCYRVDVPEEAALLVVAWLRSHGEIDAAAQLVDTIAPWFDQLRFYPAPAAQPIARTGRVRVQDVGATVQGLDKDRRQRRFEIQRAALAVWKPLRARALAMFAAGDVSAREVAALAAEVAEAKQTGAPTARAREAIALIAQLERVARDPDALSKAEHGRIQTSIARERVARGLPGTAQYDAAHARELAAVAAPLHADLRRVVVARLRALPADAGLDLDAVSAPVSAEEAAQSGVAAGTALPGYLAPKLARSWDAMLETLVDRGVVGSGEVFARLLPPITAQIRAATISDEVGRQLYVALYTAFRRRRSVLLLDLEQQVRFAELPWAAELEAARGSDLGAAHRAVADIGGLALRAFPYTITPNKLVTELDALAAAAGLALPLLKELAADIFTGRFTHSFVAAARIAARQRGSSLYQRYYGIDPAAIAALPEGAAAELSFTELCERRANTDTDNARGVVRNGKILEQGQILTTHNLAVLVDALALGDKLPSELPQRCFRRVIQLLSRPAPHVHAGLVNLKNAAYAWRQMIFYLSLTPDFLPIELLGMRDALDGSPLHDRLRPALVGLELAGAGIASSDPAFAARGGRVFTGWTAERHWLAPG